MVMEYLFAAHRREKGNLYENRFFGQKDPFFSNFFHVSMLFFHMFLITSIKKYCVFFVIVMMLLLLLLLLLLVLLLLMLKLYFVCFPSTC